MKRRYELVEKLLKQGAQPNANDGRTTLHYATAASGCMPGGPDAGHPTAVVLLGFGAVPEAEDHHGKCSDHGCCKWLEALKASMHIGPKLRVFRAISVHMFLSANQFCNLIQCFSEAGNDRQVLSSMLHTREGS